MVNDVLFFCSEAIKVLNIPSEVIGGGGKIIYLYILLHRLIMGTEVYIATI